MNPGFLEQKRTEMGLENYPSLPRMRESLADTVDEDSRLSGMTSRASEPLGHSSEALPRA
ncbi:MAG: hypothetical protein VXZ35_05335, partial [Pseudomonadota bacterium]|nr:hypothetical protein [Pseudomonadota bacterium]